MTIRVIVNGAHGKMGQETVKAVQQASDLQLVAATGEMDDLVTEINKHQAQIVIDFTTASAAYQNALTIIAANARPVIGTSGLLAEQIKDLQARCANKRLGGIIAPNFSIGAVLMMRYARDAAKFFSQVEIIEYHHDGKEDSPSGTALKTADMIAEIRNNIVNNKKQRETIPGARGATHHGIPTHAVRLPGIVAAQDVIFGSAGETLRISHNSIHRESFMPGVLLACRKVMELDQLIYGLENIL